MSFHADAEGRVFIENSGGHAGDGFLAPSCFQLGELEVNFQGFHLCERDVLVFEGPFAHEADAFRVDGVEEEFGIVDVAQVGAEQGVGVPNGLACGLVRDGARGAGDADLVVVVREVAEFRVLVGFEFGGFGGGAHGGDVYGEAIGADGGDGPEARLLTVNRRHHGEFGFAHGFEGGGLQLARGDGNGQFHSFKDMLTECVLCCWCAEYWR